MKALLKSRDYVSQILSVKANSYLGQDSVATLSFTLHFIVYFALSCSRPPFLSLYPLSSENTRGHVNLYCIVKKRGILWVSCYMFSADCWVLAQQTHRLVASPNCPLTSQLTLEIWIRWTDLTVKHLRRSFS